VESGFRLVAKDGSYFYDYKASELADLLQPYLARLLHERIF
jgi:vacuolar-type H+-ATPase subunit E/Vma4